MPATTIVLNDRYELGPVLGQGGMARVLEGRDRKLDRRVAVKVLSAPYDRDEAFLKRFRREAHAAARLSHPNVVAVFDSGSDDGTNYIVTELVDGETLADLLVRERALPPGRAVEIAMQVCAALAAAHERGVVHRDIKPGNVMLASGDHVKVVDFGIARAAGVESVTRTGLMLGTASCLSPEQARGEPGDERSDIYALGCVLYQMLTGRPPFVADSPIAALYQHVNEPVVPPSTMVPIRAALERAVLRCLEKEPSSRFASARELADALARVELDPSSSTIPLPVIGQEETAPVPRVEEAAPPTPGERATATVPALEQPAEPPGPARRSRWRLAALAAIGLLVAALVIAFGSVDLPSRAELRREARHSRTETPASVVVQESPTVTPETPSVVQAAATADDAFRALQAAIAAELSSGQISGEAAEKLQESAGKVLQEYQEGDAQELEQKLDEFADELAKAVGDGEVFSTDAVGRIEAALSFLEQAIQSDAPQSPSDGDDEDD